MAERREILERTWTRIVEFDVERNFVCGPGQTLTVDSVVRGAGWTLFSFDFARGNAVFLHVGADCNLSSAPFAYMMQFEKATHVAVVGFDELLDVTEQLPDVPRLVQFFSTGHCGSTLVHNVFNRVPGVWCVSEPMAFNKLALDGQGQDLALLLRLARAALRLLAVFPGAGAANCVVVKHFSQSSVQIKLLRDAQPRSKNLFLYRDGLSWANSCFHFVQKYGTWATVAREERSRLWRILSGGLHEDALQGLINMDAEVLPFEDMAAVAWSVQIQFYLQARAAGVSLYPLRYNELLSDRMVTLREMFAHLGLPEESVGGTLSAFEVNAHEGTRSARSATDLHFSEEHYARIRTLLALRRIALDPGIILPD